MIEIYRDSFGVPHIVCDDFNDGARATALCHCEDDFFSIQLWLLAVNKRPGALTTGMAFISTSYTNSSI